MLAIKETETIQFNIVPSSKFDQFKNDALELYEEVSEMWNDYKIPFASYRFFINKEDCSNFHELLYLYHQLSLATTEGYPDDVNKWTDEQLEDSDEMLTNHLDFLETLFIDDIMIIWDMNHMNYEMTSPDNGEDKFANPPLQGVW